MFWNTDALCKRRSLEAAVMIRKPSALSILRDLSLRGGVGGIFGSLQCEFVVLFTDAFAGV